jgi:hypothetical protein
MFFLRHGAGTQKKNKSKGSGNAAGETEGRKQARRYVFSVLK